MAHRADLTPTLTSGQNLACPLPMMTGCCHTRLQVIRQKKVIAALNDGVLLPGREDRCRGLIDALTGSSRPPRSEPPSPIGR